MVRYILEGKYDYNDMFPDEDWEQEDSFEDQDFAISQFKAYADSGGEHVHWRLRKITSETLCES